MSPRQSIPIIPAIVEVDSLFEKQQDKVSEQSVCSRRRSSIFEEIIIPDPSVCRWLLDIFSEDEHMTKESAHFILSEHQLIRVTAYTFDVVENQVILISEDEGCCGKFMHDETRTLRDITINNVNIFTLDIDKVNFLRDSYKLCLQKVRKITSILDLGDILSKLMSAANLHSLDVLIKHDEILFGSTRYNTIELVEQVNDINNQINIINNTPAEDLSEYYTKTEVDGLISDAAIGEIDLSNYYIKTETDSKLDLKADKTELIDAYTKTETDEELDLKLNITDQIDAYTKIETDEKLDLKLNITDQIDEYTKIETDEKLDLKADKTDVIDAYTKTETDKKLDIKADKTELIDAYTKTETDEKLDLKVDKTELDDYVDLTSAQTISGGDMLVGSLVTQPQLQKVRDIASGKSNGYVFATTQEMNTWMEDQENVAKLAIGDNLYIIDKQVMDYQWDGADIQVLETELPDMINVVTTLGAATGKRKCYN
ncbi:MAG: hypothetical protein EZS28_013245 [Streblomastix strix]|uniref:Uncharacterized protein n=1 Tax=Streblomastix strix TaxID=222440 RepID=A0A5J4W8N8_9EUKA|nr:MAG: hypothetical protein EZS28_013245 [Streblomastix strix]